MTGPRRLLTIVAALLALSGIAVYFATRLEPYTETITHGPSPEARADNFLAAARFLESVNIPVERLNTLPPLAGQPGSGHSLLLLNTRSRLSPGQTQALLDWAARGGHLLVAAETIEAQDSLRSDELLDRLGIERQAINAQTATGQAPEERSTFHPADESSAAELDFQSRIQLQDTQQSAQLKATSGSATHLLQRPYGQGRITVLTEAGLWHNRRIAQHDHAWLLWYLTRGTAVTLVGLADHPSLAALLLRYFPQALVALAALLILGIWHASRRQGPLLAATEHGRRQLRSHVRSLADFHLRHDGTAGLVRRLQEDIHQHTACRHPGYAELTPDARLLLLSRVSLLPQAQIEHALRAPGERLSNPDFTNQVAHLQTLRNAL